MNDCGMRFQSVKCEAGSVVKVRSTGLGQTEPRWQSIEQMDE